MCAANGVRTCENKVETTVGVTAKETEVVLSEFMAALYSGYLQDVPSIWLLCFHEVE